MAAIFDLLHAQTWNRIHSSLSVLSDPGNMGVAIWISLLSCIRADIYVMSYLLSVNGRHLLFTTCPDTEQHRCFFSLCFMSLKTCYFRWNCVAIMYISWDTCDYIISAAISYVRCLLIDFSTAFDVVDHVVLADKLSKLHIPKCVFNWLISFLIASVNVKWQTNENQFTTQTMTTAGCRVHPMTE